MQQEKRSYEKYAGKAGDTFGRLTLTGVTYFAKKYGSRYRFVEAECECGYIRPYLYYELKSGHTRSCGCLRTDMLRKYPNARIHGLSKHPLYTMWRGMRERCYYHHHNRYHRYGALGIRVCDEWRYDFQEFFDWAMTQKWKQGMSIERIENKGNYEPDNCKFIPLADQKKNTSATRLFFAFGEYKMVEDWATDPRCKIGYGSLVNRLYRDTITWKDIEKAITTPPIVRGRSISNRVEKRIISAFGEEKSLADWLSDSRCIVDENRFRERLRKGWHPEKSMTTYERKLPK